MRAAATGLILVAGALALAGCASHPRERRIAAAAPPPVLTAPLPTGASPGMLVPQPLADGSFPTPNRALSSDGAVWHLRAGLNVAALSCGGEQGQAIRAGYNRWLTAAKAPLAGAATRYAGEYGSATPTGRDAFDDAMTRLYNYFAQTPVRPAFCAAAAGLVAALPVAGGAELSAFAVTRLADLDRPFTDFYRAYDAWRRSALAPVTIAAAQPAATAAVTRGPGGLVLDPSQLPLDPAVTASR
jgi:hypothetical protein